MFAGRQNRQTSANTRICERRKCVWQAAERCQSHVNIHIKNPYQVISAGHENTNIYIFFFCCSCFCRRCTINLCIIKMWAHSFSHYLFNDVWNVIRECGEIQRQRTSQYRIYIYTSTVAETHNTHIFSNRMWSENSKRMSVGLMSWQLLEICMFSSDNHAQCTHTHTQIRTDAYDWKNGVCVWDIYRCRLSISTSSCQSFDASLACTSGIQYIPHELFWFSSVSFFACNFMNEKPARHSPRTANAIALRNFNDIFFLFSICYAHFCGWFTMHKSGTRACDG